MFYINVTYKLPAENRDAFAKSILENKIPELVRQERGNHAYDFSLSIEHPDEVYLREIWDEDAFEEHRTSPNVKLFGTIKEKFGASTEITKSRF